jgi:hypothetical protein
MTARYSNRCKKCGVIPAIDNNELEQANALGANPARLECKVRRSLKQLRRSLRTT